MTILTLMVIIMTHDLKLYEENFERIKSGNKIREYRLYDEKRRKINVGDTIRFIKLPSMDQFLYAEVADIEIFKDWHSCYAKYFEEDFKDRYSSVQDVVDDTYSGGYYTKEDSDKYGCCSLTLSKVRTNK